MYGNGGADILIGGAGKDELWGGAGSDTFVFRTPDATSTDRVKDFAAGDHIGIYASDYGLSLGHGLVDDGTGKLVLDPTYFAAVAGSAGTVQGTSSGHGQFVFSSTASTHTLMWDADGAGPSHGVALATFNLDTTPSVADFLVFSTPPTVTAQGSPDPAPERADAHVAFTINLSVPWNEDVLLTYSTVNGTATAGSDFVGVSHGQVTIPAGSTSATVLIDVLADSQPELLKSLNIQLNRQWPSAAARRSPLPTARPAAPSRRRHPQLSRAPTWRRSAAPTPPESPMCPAWGSSSAMPKSRKARSSARRTCGSCSPTAPRSRSVQPVELRERADGPGLQLRYGTPVHFRRRQIQDLLGRSGQSPSQARKDRSQTPGLQRPRGRGSQYEQRPPVHRER